MKFVLNRIKITSLILILPYLLIVSCTNDNENIAPFNEVYLSIPDSIFEAILIEQGIDSDGIVNQQMLKIDAEKVSILDLNLTSIGVVKDLTGIEGFKNLRTLSAIMHDIESVNLGFNIKLDTIYLQGNQLTSIDLSKNANLIFADFSSNYLSSITGISELIALKDLRLSDNLLDNFKIDNPSVENLLISHNLLKSFDATGAIHLEHILLRLNKIKILDFSSNLLLETVNIDNNNIESINIQQNTKIKYLLLHNNNLSILDVSNFPELIKLNAHNNPNLTCIKIQKNQDIPTLSISNYQELNNICN